MPDRLVARALSGRLSGVVGTLAVMALACNLPIGPEAGGSSQGQGAAGSEAQEIYDQAGVSLEQAMAVEPLDRRSTVLDVMGSPDVFTLRWHLLEGQTVRWEEWSYFDFGTRLDFVDGELLWRDAIEPAPDGSVYAHWYDPLDFRYGMSLEQVQQAVPSSLDEAVSLEEGEVPEGTLVAGDQILLGFDGGQLVYVQTFLLAPEESGALSLPSTSQPEGASPATQTVGDTDTQPGASSSPAPERGGDSYLLADDFTDPAGSAVALFGEGLMRFEVADGQGVMRAADPGLVLAAMYDTAPVRDFTAELTLRTSNAPPGAGYGLIFRSDDLAGGLAHYYLLLVRAADHRLNLMAFREGAWVLDRSFPLDPTVLAASGRHQLGLDAAGNQFTVAFDGGSVATIVDNSISTAGLFGLAMATPREGDEVVFEGLYVSASE